MDTLVYKKNKCCDIFQVRTLKKVQQIYKNSPLKKYLGSECLLTPRFYAPAAALRKRGTIDLLLQLGMMDARTGTGLTDYACACAETVQEG